jgi:hypothetical protein
VSHPIYPAAVSRPDPLTGTVTVTIGDHPPVVVLWRGSAMDAVNDALDRIECESPAAAGLRYPFTAIEELLAGLAPEDRRAG